MSWVKWCLSFKMWKAEFIATQKAGVETEACSSGVFECLKKILREGLKSPKPGRKSEPLQKSTGCTELQTHSLQIPDHLGI